MYNTQTHLRISVRLRCPAATLSWSCAVTVIRTKRLLSFSLSLSPWWFQLRPSLTLCTRWVKFTSEPQRASSCPWLVGTIVSVHLTRILAHRLNLYVLTDSLHVQFERHGGECCTPGGIVFMIHVSFQRERKYFIPSIQLSRLTTVSYVA